MNIFQKMEKPNIKSFFLLVNSDWLKSILFD